MRAVHRVFVVSGALLFVLTGGIWFVYDWPLAQSVLIGGLLANGSFFLLKRDAYRLMQRLSESTENSGQGVDFEKTRFFLRSVARLLVFALLLFMLASQITIHVGGLIAGLATIMISVIVVGLRLGRH